MILASSQENLIVLHVNIKGSACPSDRQNWSIFLPSPLTQRLYWQSETFTVSNHWAKYEHLPWQNVNSFTTTHNNFCLFALLKLYFGSLHVYCKHYVPWSDCSLRSTLIRVQSVCYHDDKTGLECIWKHAIDVKSRQHFQNKIHSLELRVNIIFLSIRYIVLSQCIVEVLSPLYSDGFTHTYAFPNYDIFLSLRIFFP